MANHMQQVIRCCMVIIGIGDPQHLPCLAHTTRAGHGHQLTYRTPIQRVASRARHHLQGLRNGVMQLACAYINGAY